MIHKLEEHLPAAIYTYEWQLADEGKGKELPRSDNPRTVHTSPVRSTPYLSDDHDHSRHRRRSGLDEITTLAWLLNLG